MNRKTVFAQLVLPHGVHAQANIPDIDALAKGGMLYTNTHTRGAACPPADTHAPRVADEDE